MTNNSEPISVNGIKVLTFGRFPRIGRLASEYYVALNDPLAFLDAVKASGVKADVFTFVQPLHDTTPRFAYCRETDAVAVMPVSTYDHWFTKQLNNKSRNMVRKALKVGVEARVVEFNDEFVHAIKAVYDESPTRQGKPNIHYKKDFETLKREHSTFLDRSQFIGVFHGDQMIGFAKLTYTDTYAVVMNILSMICHRDKAPTNLLVAKAVEVCASKNLGLLKYGVWGGQGLTDFKVANGFERCEVPRYYVPLNWRGRLALNLGLHRSLADILPKRFVRLLAEGKRKLTAPKSPRRVAEQN